MNTTLSTNDLKLRSTRPQEVLPAVPIMPDRTRDCELASRRRPLHPLPGREGRGEGGPVPTSHSRPLQGAALHEPTHPRPLPRGEQAFVRILSGLAAVALLAPLAAVSAAEPSPAAANAPVAAPTPELLVREIRYDGKLTDMEAKFVADIDAESLSKDESSIALFDGDVAVMPAKLPTGLRMVREGRQYRLVAARPGRYRFKLEMVAKIIRAEPWNQISFIGPDAGIASVTAQAARADVEMQLLSGTPVESEKDQAARARGVLGADRKVALRWQSRTTEAARKALFTCDTVATARITPTVIKFATQLRYEIVQGNLSRFSILLPANHALTRVEGEQIRDWQITAGQASHPPAAVSTPDSSRDENDARPAAGPFPAAGGLAGGPNIQILTVELIKPVEKSYALKVFTEQTVETTPYSGEVTLPQPEGVERETGSLIMSAEDTVVETASTAGLRQIDAPPGSIAAYRFYGRPLALGVELHRIEPVIAVASRVTARLEEARLLVTHTLTLNVEKAGLYSLELSPLNQFVVTDVRGDGIEDWKARDGQLLVNFSSRVLGERKLDVQLEQSERTFSDQIVVTPLQIAGATRQTAQIGAASAPGIRLKTTELNGLREVPVSNLVNRSDELLAYTADQADWMLTLSAERLAPRVVADIFNLVTIGDGLLGGSATVRYVIANQGVQEFRVKLPARWKNVDFTGPSIRRKEAMAPVADATADTNHVVWSIGLQDKTWGGYTLVVTYDEQFDPHKATLALGDIHALEVERETGSVAVTSAASLQLRQTRAIPSLQRIDENELAETDRALIAHSVLLAYRYGGGEAYQLNVDVTRFEELPVLDAVADRTQLTTVLTESGQMLTQASFMVKNNDKQFQRFTLPAGAEFWSAYVNGQAVKAEKENGGLLVPLPRGENRDQTFAVEIVYAQNIGSLKSITPREIALAAPKTDIQTTFAEWELYVPASYELAKFGGNMNVARGTTYGLRDAWEEFVQTYRDLLRNSAGLWIGLLAAGLLSALVLSAIHRGFHGAMTVVVSVTVMAILAGMLLPALSKSKAKAQRVSAVNSLKQIGLALRMRADENNGQLPATLEELKEQVGSEKILNDPESGRRFEYVAGGRSDVNPETVLAYSPVDHGGRAVLLGDGAVVQMNNDQFIEALARTRSWAAAAPPPGPGVQPPQLTAAGDRDGVKAGELKPGATMGGGFAAAGPRGVAGSSAAAPAFQVPLAHGIRPIHIEIPRIGQRITFTKVLNVGDETLKFQAWAMTARTLHVLRSALQLFLFLAGLLLLWRQMRRGAPNSLVVTIALSLVLGSVGSMLIATRLLGTALIVAAPVIGLAILILLARKYWRRFAGAAPASEAAGTQTPPGPNSTAGMGPAIATIALLFLAATADATDIARQPATHNPQPATTSVSIQSATYTGTVHERVARLEAVLQLSAAQAGQTIALFGDDVAVEQFSAAPGDAKLLRQGNSVSVRLVKRGDATLRLTFLVKLGGDVTKRELAFGIPPSLSSKLSLALDEAEAAVEFPTAVSFHSVAAQHQTRVEAVMGACERVELRWAPRVKRAAEIAATVFCQNATLVSFDSGVMNTRSSLDFQITQGEMREVRVRLPAGQRLLRVEGDAIRTWQIDVGQASHLPQRPVAAEVSRPATLSPDLESSRAGTGAAGSIPLLGGVRRGLIPLAGEVRGKSAADSDDDHGDILVVELLKGISPNYRLTIETEKTVEKLPDTFALDTPHALEVKRETGFVALSGSDELGLIVEAVRGLQKVDASEFMKVTAQTNALAAAYQFLKSDFALSVRVETLRPQIEAVAHNRLRISAEQLYLTTQVDYTIKRAGVFALRLALPKDFRIENVAANLSSRQASTADSRPQPQSLPWVEKTENDVRLLEVSLSQRTLGNFSLQLHLVKSQQELPKTVEVAAVHPLDTVKLTGFVVVSSDVGVAIKTASFEGLSEVPVAAVKSSTGTPPAHRDGAGETPALHPGSGLAYKFIANDPVPATSPWKLVVTTEAIESWVRAEVVNWLTLSDTLASGRALVRYEIQNAPVKEFRLQVPAAFRNIEITGPNIRRRDQNGGEWRVELQNKVVGTYLLTVTWEQSWSVKDQAQETLLDAAGIMAAGVERETGAMAIIAKSELKVAPGQASSELIRIDPQELPEWAGRAGPSTVLAYRYLRPGYKLSVGAQRFAQADVLQALVDDARLTTVVADDGQMMTELALSLRNNGRQFLEVTLPKGARVWSAFVSGQAVKPSQREGKLLLPVERANDAAIPVDVIYVSAETFPRRKGPVDLASPALDVPVKNARWELYLPADYGYSRFAGTMTHEAEAAPDYHSFTLSDYSQAETKSRRAREMEVSGSLEDARRKLSVGKLEAASRAYNQARRANPNEEQVKLQELEKDLRKAQGGNLLNAQQAVIDNNSLYFQSADQPARQQQVLQYDDKAAEQQWDRLQRAQEVATAMVRPLRVNLPTRGLRQSFSQVLQTEVGKPMLVHFVAANAKAASWSMRIGMAIVAFVGLWGLVTLALGRRTTATKPAQASA